MRILPESRVREGEVRSKLGCVAFTKRTTPRKKKKKKKK
jgi:hypothetical protein